MSVAFIICVPFAIGYVTVAAFERNQSYPWITWLFMPWGAVVVGIAISMLLAWEGSICVAFFLPLALLASSLGGVIAGVVSRYSNRRTSYSALALVLLLPWISGSIEQGVPIHHAVRTVSNDIEIAASPEIVWNHIKSVSPIDGQELPRTWTQQIGFPPPIEATLSHEGLGGVRHATFAGGIVFVETIDTWQPQQKLSFSIKADAIPPTTLDPHVTIGGPYFDVLRGTYELEPLPNGNVRLHLSSEHRLGTNFNWYASLWSDAVMSDIQRNILEVIQTRCERERTALPQS